MKKRRLYSKKLQWLTQAARLVGCCLCHRCRAPSFRLGTGLPHGAFLFHENETEFCTNLRKPIIRAHFLLPKPQYLPATMSAAADGSGPTTKATVSDSTDSSTLKDQQKPAAALEEDDEFEDFPVDGMSHSREPKLLNFTYKEPSKHSSSFKLLLI